MSAYHETLEISAHSRGFHEITDRVAGVVSASSIEAGSCGVFVQHTSAGLCIQENADPSARRDMEAWLDRIAPENHPEYTHTTEGPDDMPAHLKAILTGTSVEVPVINGRLAMGTWQGIYFCEFRNRPGTRRVVVMVR